MDWRCAAEPRRAIRLRPRYCSLASEDRRSHVDPTTSSSASARAVFRALAICRRGHACRLQRFKERLRAPAAAEGAGCPAAAAAGDRISRPHRQHAGLRHGRSRGSRAGLSHLHRLCRWRARSRQAPSYSASSATSTRRRLTSRRRRSPPTRPRRNTTRPNMGGRRRSVAGFRQPGDGAGVEVQVGPVGRGYPERQGRHLARQDQLGYTQVLAPFDGVVTNHLSMSARWSASGRRPSLRRSSRPIRSTSISP